MGFEEVFTSAGVTPRSHNLGASVSSSHIFYASGQFVVVENVPEATSKCGRVVVISECRHTKPITVLKRAKSELGNDIFVSGGADGVVNLWKLTGEKLVHAFRLEVSNVPIVSVSVAVRGESLLVAASWGEELAGGLKTWWLEKEEGQLVVKAEADMADTLPKRSFVLAMDCHILQNGRVLLAVGTSLRKVELYAETEKSFSRRLSVVGHTDWIHSIAFNDSHGKLLLASAGQDTYVKLWKVEENVEGEDEEELSVTKNKFTIECGGGVEHRMSFNVEAVMGGHEDWVHSTEWNSDGTRLVTASSDKTVIVWEEQNEMWSDTVRLGIVGGQAAGFFAAVFTPDNRSIVASSYFGGLHCWRAGDESDSLWSPVTMSGGHVGEVRDVSWSPTGAYLLSVGKDQTTRLFASQKDTGDFVEIARPQVHGYDMQCITAVSNSCFVSGGEEKIFRAFRAPETFANSLCAIGGLVKEEVFGEQVLESSGARLPALGLSNKAIEEGEQPEETTHWEEAAFQAKPEDLIFPPGEDCLQQNTLWPELHKLYAHGFEVYASACNPSGKVLATACKASHAEHASIILWEVATWNKKATIPGHTLTVTQIEWSPDGRHLLSVSRDRTAVLYRETSGDLDGFSYEKVWASGKEHSRIIWSCAWLSDSKHFLTASRDMKVILWLVETSGARAVSFVKLPQPITAIAAGSGPFSDSIACGMQDGSLCLLKVESNKLVVQETFLQPSVSIDSAVLRLRFHPRPTESSQLVAYAGTNGLTRILRVSL